MKKLIVALALTLITLAGVALSPVTPQAEARPAPAQMWVPPSGKYFWVKTPKCKGNVRVDLYTDRRHRGRTTFKLTPTRFTRTCTVKVWVGWGTMGVDQIRIPITSGPRGGKAVKRTYRTGSGVFAMAAGHRPSVSSVYFYVLVP